MSRTDLRSEEDLAPAGPASGVVSPLLLGLAAASALGIAVVAWLAFVVTGPDTELGETVRLIYVHVPSATSTYVAASICWVASIVWLRRRSEWWDLLAESSGEVAVVYAALTIATGMLWGKPTWGTYWEWDARLTTMLMLFLLLLGHRTLRSSSDDPDVASRRAAWLGLLLVPNIFVVNRSVEWWRSLHQDTTVQTLDPKIDGNQLLTFGLSMVVMFVVVATLIVLRFRLGWLSRQAAGAELDDALEARRAEAGS